MSAHRSVQWLRALLQPAVLSGLAVIAICWIGLAYLLSAERHFFADYERQQILHIVLAAVLTLLVLIAVNNGIRRQSSLEQTNLRFSTALENMTHGLCMFDAEKRLVVCNQRYADLYRLPPELSKTGTPHQAIIAHRVKNRIFAIEKDAGAVGQSSSDEISSRVKELADGRL